MAGPGHENNGCEIHGILFWLDCSSVPLAKTSRAAVDTLVS